MISRLLIKLFLKGESSTDDSSELFQWANRNKRTRQYLNDIIESSKRGFTPLDEAQLCYQINQIKEGKLHFPYLRYFILTGSIAASVVLALWINDFKRVDMYVPITEEIGNEPRRLSVPILSTNGLNQSLNLNTSQQELIDCIEKAGVKEIKTTNSTIIVPSRCIWEGILADGTIIKINANSKVILSHHPTHIKRRDIELVYGEMYLHVYKDSLCPFYVKTPYGEVNVLGTSFNVKNNGTEQVALVSGLISYSTTRCQVKLRPGEVLVSQKEGEVRLSHFNTQETLAWLNNRFVFNGKTLEEICNELETWYEIDLQFLDNRLRSKKFYLDVSKDVSVDSVLKSLSICGKLNYSRSDKTYYLFQ